MTDAGSHRLAPHRRVSHSRRRTESPRRSSAGLRNSRYKLSLPVCPRTVAGSLRVTPRHSLSSSRLRGVRGVHRQTRLSGCREWRACIFHAATADGVELWFKNLPSSYRAPLEDMHHLEIFLKLDCDPPWQYDTQSATVGGGVSTISAAPSTRAWLRDLPEVPCTARRRPEYPLFEDERASLYTERAMAGRYHAASGWMVSCCQGHCRAVDCDSAASRPGVVMLAYAAGGRCRLQGKTPPRERGSQTAKNDSPDAMSSWLRYHLSAG